MIVSHTIFHRPTPRKQQLHTHILKHGPDIATRLVPVNTSLFHQAREAAELQHVPYINTCSNINVQASFYRLQPACNGFQKAVLDSQLMHWGLWRNSRLRHQASRHDIIVLLEPSTKAFESVGSASNTFFVRLRISSFRPVIVCIVAPSYSVSWSLQPDAIILTRTCSLSLQTICKQPRKPKRLSFRRKTREAVLLVPMPFSIHPIAAPSVFQRTPESSNRNIEWQIISLLEILFETSEREQKRLLYGFFTDGCLHMQGSRRCLGNGTNVAGECLDE